MSAPRRKGGNPDVLPYAALASVGSIWFSMFMAWSACSLAYHAGEGPEPSKNPAGFTVDLATGVRDWPGGVATGALAGEVAAVGAALAVGSRVVRKRKRSRIDVAARHMARNKDIQHLSAKSAAATAARLGTKAKSPGIKVGNVIPSRAPLYGTYEDLHIDIWGTRTGKTTSRAIPAILDAPGAVIVTSNKRDIVDGSRGPREKEGPVWIFDPQKVANAKNDWFWNPLTYVTDVDHASRLAAIFTAYGRDPGARGDAYFEPEGEALLAYLLLAAAEGEKQITEVYRWLSDPTDDTAVKLLRKAEHELPAEHVQGVLNYPDRQRGGVFATARKSINCLVNPEVTKWVVPGESREFDPDAFVRSNGTLYSLSYEGQGTAGPLVTALTVATIEAAERLATASPGGRLQTPMVAVLDEAANVCRWRELPNLYSHYGSRGILLMTILQSWAQGVEVWGEHGMNKLWGASNIRVYGGGGIDTRFLADLSQLIGDYDPTNYSTTVQTGRGQHSHSVSASRSTEKIMDVADLFGLPRGRAVVFPSGAPAVLVETVPWTQGPHAAAVRESLANYGPGA